MACFAVERSHRLARVLDPRTVFVEEEPCFAMVDRL